MPSTPDAILFGLSIKDVSQIGIATLELVAIVILWRANAALLKSFMEYQSQMQARYEAVLERCVAALVRVDDLLNK